MTPELILTVLTLVVCIVACYFDWEIRNFVKMEYQESKAGNQLLKRLLNSRKRSTAKALIKEVLKQDSPA